MSDPITSFDESVLKTFPATFESLEQHANYSQHTMASSAAIDFKNIDGAPSDDHPEDFKDTVEYPWLRRRGGEFRFHESWPAPGGG
jgi:hypothetical protein